MVSALFLASLGCIIICGVMLMNELVSLSDKSIQNPDNVILLAISLAIFTIVSLANFLLLQITLDEISESNE